MNPECCHSILFRISQLGIGIETGRTLLPSTSAANRWSINSACVQFGSKLSIWNTAFLMISTPNFHLAYSSLCLCLPISFDSAECLLDYYERRQVEDYKVYLVCDAALLHTSLLRCCLTSARFSSVGIACRAWVGVPTPWLFGKSTSIRSVMYVALLHLWKSPLIPYESIFCITDKIFIESAFSKGTRDRSSATIADGDSIVHWQWWTGCR